MELLRKMAACFRSGAPAARGARRGRHPSRSSEGRSAGSSSGGSSPGRLGGSSGGSGADTSEKGSSGVLVRLTSRLRSWLKRTRAAPEGCFSVDVGIERIRHIIPVAYLSHENLQALLDESVAEFGYSHSGVLQLACEEDDLLMVLDTIRWCDDQGGARSISRTRSIFAAAKNT